jgi:hypothetical protein
VSITSGKKYDEKYTRAKKNWIIIYECDIVIYIIKYIPRKSLRLPGTMPDLERRSVSRNYSPKREN